MKLDFVVQSSQYEWKKAVLIGFVAGDFAESIENLTDARITEQAVASLLKIFSAMNSTTCTHGAQFSAQTAACNIFELLGISS